MPYWSLGLVSTGLCGSFIYHVAQNYNCEQISTLEPEARKYVSFVFSYSTGAMGHFMRARRDFKGGIQAENALANERTYYGAANLILPTGEPFATGAFMSAIARSFFPPRNEDAQTWGQFVKKANLSCLS